MLGMVRDDQAYRKSRRKEGTPRKSVGPLGEGKVRRWRKKRRNRPDARFPLDRSWGRFKRGLNANGEGKGTEPFSWDQLSGVADKAQGKEWVREAEVVVGERNKDFIIGPWEMGTRHPGEKKVGAGVSSCRPTLL